MIEPASEASLDSALAADRSSKIRELRVDAAGTPPPPLRRHERHRQHRRGRQHRRPDRRRDLGDISLNNTTVASNSAYYNLGWLKGGLGGGINVSEGSLVVRNSTITGYSPSNGGGIAARHSPARRCQRCCGHC